MREYVERSIGLVTALLPALGYEKCTALAKEALETGRGVAELVIEKKLMTRKELDQVLDPATMVSGNH
jgi:aspartate ammonia-lyase